LNDFRGKRGPTRKFVVPGKNYWPNPNQR